MRRPGWLVPAICLCWAAAAVGQRCVLEGNDFGGHHCQYHDDEAACLGSPKSYPKVVNNMVVTEQAYRCRWLSSGCKNPCAYGARPICYADREAGNTSPLLGTCVPYESYKFGTVELNRGVDQDQLQRVSAFTRGTFRDEKVQVFTGGELSRALEKYSTLGQLSELVFRVSGSNADDHLEVMMWTGLRVVYHDDGISVYKVPSGYFELADIKIVLGSVVLHMKHEPERVRTVTYQNNAGAITVSPGRDFAEEVLSTMPEVLIHPVFDSHLPILFLAEKYRSDYYAIPLSTLAGYAVGKRQGTLEAADSVQLYRCMFGLFVSCTPYALHQIGHWGVEMHFLDNTLSDGFTPPSTGMSINPFGRFSSDSVDVEVQNDELRHLLFRRLETEGERYGVNVYLEGTHPALDLVAPYIYVRSSSPRHGEPTDHLQAPGTPRPEWELMYSGFPFTLQWNFLVRVWQQKPGSGSAPSSMDSLGCSDVRGSIEEAIKQRMLADGYHDLNNYHQNLFQRLEAMNKEGRTGRRSTSALMGGWPATAAARQCGAFNQVAYEWLHRVAFSMAGQPADNPYNLMLGTEFANSHMLSFEMVAKWAKGEDTGARLHTDVCRDHSQTPPLVIANCLSYAPGKLWYGMATGGGNVVHPPFEVKVFDLYMIFKPSKYINFVASRTVRLRAQSTGGGGRRARALSSESMQDAMRSLLQLEGLEWTERQGASDVHRELTQRYPTLGDLPLLPEAEGWSGRARARTSVGTRDFNVLSYVVPRSGLEPYHMTQLTPLGGEGMVEAVGPFVLHDQHLVLSHSEAGLSQLYVPCRVDLANRFDFIPALGGALTEPLRLPVTALGVLPYTDLDGIDLDTGFSLLVDVLQGKTVPVFDLVAGVSLDLDSIVLAPKITSLYDSSASRFHRSVDFMFTAGGTLRWKGQTVTVGVGGGSPGGRTFLMASVSNWEHPFGMDITIDRADIWFEYSPPAVRVTAQVRFDTEGTVVGASGYYRDGEVALRGSLEGSLALSGIVRWFAARLGSAVSLAGSMPDWVVRHVEMAVCSKPHTFDPSFRCEGMLLRGKAYHGVSAVEVEAVVSGSLLQLRGKVERLAVPVAGGTTLTIPEAMLRVEVGRGGSTEAELEATMAFGGSTVHLTGRYRRGDGGGGVSVSGEVKDLSLAGIVDMAAQLFAGDVRVPGGAPSFRVVAGRVSVCTFETDCEDGARGVLVTGEVVMDNMSGSVSVGVTREGVSFEVQVAEVKVGEAVLGNAKLKFKFDRHAASFSASISTLIRLSDAKVLHLQGSYDTHRIALGGILADGALAMPDLIHLAESSRVVDLPDHHRPDLDLAPGAQVTLTSTPFAFAAQGTATLMGRAVQLGVGISSTGLRFEGKVDGAIDIVKGEVSVRDTSIGFDFAPSASKKVEMVARAELTFGEHVSLTVHRMVLGASPSVEFRVVNSVGTAFSKFELTGSAKLGPGEGREVSVSDEYRPQYADDNHPRFQLVKAAATLKAPPMSGTVELDSRLRVADGKGGHDDLLFVGSVGFDFAAQVASGEIGMAGMWRRAFGLAFLYLTKLSLGVGVQVETLEPTYLKLEAEACLGSEGCCAGGGGCNQLDESSPYVEFVASAVFDEVHMDRNYFVVAVTKLTVAKMLAVFSVEYPVLGRVARHLPGKLLESGVYPLHPECPHFSKDCTAILSWATADHEVEIHHTTLTLQRGLYVSGRLDLLGWNLRVELAVSDTRIHFDVACDKLSLHFLELTAAGDHSSGPRFTLSVGDEPFQMFLDGRVAIPSLGSSAELQVRATRDEFVFDGSMSLLWGALEVEGAKARWAWDMSRFSVSLKDFDFAGGLVDVENVELRRGGSSFHFSGTLSVLWGVGSTSGMLDIDAQQGATTLSFAFNVSSVFGTAEFSGSGVVVSPFEDTRFHVAHTIKASRWVEAVSRGVAEKVEKAKRIWGHVEGVVEAGWRDVKHAVKTVFPTVTELVSAVDSFERFVDVGLAAASEAFTKLANAGEKIVLKVCRELLSLCDDHHDEHPYAPAGRQEHNPYGCPLFTAGGEPYAKKECMQRQAQEAARIRKLSDAVRAQHRALKRSRERNVGMWDLIQNNRTADPPHIDDVVTGFGDESVFLQDFHGQAAVLKSTTPGYLWPVVGTGSEAALSIARDGSPSAFEVVSGLSHSTDGVSFRLRSDPLLYVTRSPDGTCRLLPVVDTDEGRGRATWGVVSHRSGTYSLYGGETRRYLRHSGGVLRVDPWAEHPDFYWAIDRDPPLARPAADLVKAFQGQAVRWRSTTPGYEWYMSGGPGADVRINPNRLNARDYVVLPGVSRRVGGVTMRLRHHPLQYVVREGGKCKVRSFEETDDFRDRATFSIKSHSDGTYSLFASEGAGGTAYVRHRHGWLYLEPWEEHRDFFWRIERVPSLPASGVVFLRAFGGQVVHLRSSTPGFTDHLAVREGSSVEIGTGEGLALRVVAGLSTEVAGVSFQLQSDPSLFLVDSGELCLVEGGDSESFWGRATWGVERSAKEGDYHFYTVTGVPRYLRHQFGTVKVHQWVAGNADFAWRVDGTSGAPAGPPPPLAWSDGQSVPEKRRVRISGHALKLAGEGKPGARQDVVHDASVYFTPESYEDSLHALGGEVVGKYVEAIVSQLAGLDTDEEMRKMARDVYNEYGIPVHHEPPHLTDIPTDAVYLGCAFELERFEERRPNIVTDTGCRANAEVRMYSQEMLEGHEMDALFPDRACGAQYVRVVWKGFDDPLCGGETQPATVYGWYSHDDASFDSATLPGPRTFNTADDVVAEPPRVSKECEAKTKVTHRDTLEQLYFQCGYAISRVWSVEPHPNPRGCKLVADGHTQEIRVLQLLLVNTSPPPAVVARLGGRPVRLRATTPGYETWHLSLRGSAAWIQPGVDGALEFEVIPGLSETVNGVSLRCWNEPTTYLTQGEASCHVGPPGACRLEVYSDARDSAFRDRATWSVEEIAGGLYRFRAAARPQGEYLRHANSIVRIDPAPPNADFDWAVEYTPPASTLLLSFQGGLKARLQSRGVYVRLGWPGLIVTPNWWDSVIGFTVVRGLDGGQGVSLRYDDNQGEWYVTHQGGGVVMERSSATAAFRTKATWQVSTFGNWYHFKTGEGMELGYSFETNRVGTFWPPKLWGVGPTVTTYDTEWTTPHVSSALAWLLQRFGGRQVNLAVPGTNLIASRTLSLVEHTDPNGLLLMLVEGPWYVDGMGVTMVDFGEGGVLGHLRFLPNTFGEQWAKEGTWSVEMHGVSFALRATGTTTYLMHSGGGLQLGGWNPARCLWGFVDPPPLTPLPSPVTSPGICQDVYGKELIYLDRHVAEAPSGSALKGWRMTPVGCPVGQQRLEAVHQRPRGLSNCVHSMTSCQPAEEKLQYLDRHPISCNVHRGGVLTRWKMTRSGCTGVDSRIEYTCCKAQGYRYSLSGDLSTGCQVAWDKELEYLDRHNIMCGGESLLSQWRLVSCGGETMQVLYNCRNREY